MVRSVHLHGLTVGTEVNFGGEGKPKPPLKYVFSPSLNKTQKKKNIYLEMRI